MAFLETDFLSEKENKINLISSEFQCTRPRGYQNYIYKFDTVRFKRKKLVVLIASKKRETTLQVSIRFV